MQESKFYVCYKVIGFPNSFKAGPYTKKTIESHREDIELSDGTYNVSIKGEEEIKEES